jgi:hypothetical protein
MKKSINLLRLISIFAFLFFGCSDDMDNENFDPETINELMENLYLKMYSTGTGGTNNHADFGHKSYDLFSDLLSGDMAYTNSSTNWSTFSGPFPSLVRVSKYLSTTDFIDDNNYQVWTHYYGVIEIANTIIDFLGGDSANPENEIDRHYLGQALAMRAHSYFYLTQYMSNDYDPAAEILPIYRELSNEYAVKSSTAEVFALIESDLNRAIILLENYNRPTKTQVNKFVAQAILAYVVTAQRDVSRMNEVVDLCDQVIAASGASIMNYTEMTGGFNNADISGWIWAQDISAETELSLASWWSQIDIFSYGYAWAGESKGIDQNLYNTIQTDDVRKTQFFTETGFYSLLPVNKFYDSDRIVGGLTEFNDADYLYMRISELYYLKAESLAKMGQDATARVTLAEVLSQRLPDTNYLNSLSGVALEDEIYLQTRIEFWGEGKAYLALKRNERSTGIRGENHHYTDLIGTSFAHNDERLTFEIPESEILNNEHINEQN